jgi:hypothetical protein
MIINIAPNLDLTLHAGYILILSSDSSGVLEFNLRRSLWTVISDHSGTFASVCLAISKVRKCQSMDLNVQENRSERSQKAACRFLLGSFIYSKPGYPLTYQLMLALLDRCYILLHLHYVLFALSAVSAEK